MTRATLFFALFCLGVVACYFLSARNGWSPFASGGNRGFFYYGGRTGGPNHK
jgi:hypothetical protein